ncbi:hypothetical protein CCO03_15280 [Comamonas serinivorans]|uniref:Uncharacterized protein n=1 Tax=Comamonas serinivorans TaxID=1082851 RepID=A0A1Y0EQC3_9BURK|nr:hypothetical protein CCO03_15280 [Comamonas serinivorans]
MTLGVLMTLTGMVAQAQTAEFTTPGVHSYTVPTGVQALDVTLSGGGGGSGTGVRMAIGIPGFDGTFPGGSGGDAAQVTARVAVTPGDVVSITVAAGGGAGEDDQSAATPLEGGLGGMGAGSGGRSADGTIGNTPPITPVYTAGGGGGASAVTLAGRFYLRAGGGGGGSSAAYGQSIRDVGTSGLAAPLNLDNVADCSTPADGEPGFPSTDGSIGGGTTIATGAGGGGGYLNQAGQGGASGAGLVSDGSNWWWLHATKPTSATGGGSCYHAASAAYPITNAQITVGAPGALVDPGTLVEFPLADNVLAANGADGWVRITPVAAPVQPSVAPVPAVGLGALVALALGMAGAVVCRRTRR